MVEDAMGTMDDDMDDTSDTVSLIQRVKLSEIGFFKMLEFKSIDLFLNFHANKNSFHINIGTR